PVYYRLVSFDLDGIRTEYKTIALNCLESGEIIETYNLTGQKIKLNKFTESGVYLVVYEDYRVEKIYFKGH
ncbi:MAG: hypothetical protein MK066_07465, partial [Crocinitomicaceae bacterium]|nr:hypothetical protein [Crocinitomicaceae bacterium]